MSFACKFCNSQFKNPYTLKSHENGSKKCLTNRGLKLETKNQCIGCNLVFVNKYNLKLHEDVCRNFLQHQHNNEILEKDKLLSDFKEEQEKRYTEMIEESQKKLAELTHKHDQKLADLTQTNEKFLALLKEEHARQIADLKQQNDKLQENIQNLAREAINRPTTSSTTNNTVNNIRNNLSTQYTLDEIKTEELMELFRENLTEKVFMSGQKGLAKLCTDKLINTKDAKKLICCTDVTRKKFKYMDKKGNVIEDIEAREFVNKVTKPIKEAGRHVYDTMMSTISDERDHVREDDYGKKDRLVTQSFQVMDRYKDIINIDDTKYNTEFTNELAILNKNSGTGMQDSK
jgi:hypothetical protein